MTLDIYGQIMHTTAYENDTESRRKYDKKGFRIDWRQGKTSLVRLGLEALIALESSKRLAEIGGTERGLRPIPRRKSSLK